MSGAPHFTIFNESGNQVNTTQMEFPEQLLSWRFIQPDDCVLELGGRYGSVACTINTKLTDKTKHVCVEPDERVWYVLEKNRDINQCSFHILKGCISKKPRSLTNLSVFYGYGTRCIQDNQSTVPCYTLDQVKEMFGIDTFTALVADCEGCLEDFLFENPSLLDTLRLFLFEKDYPEYCNYEKITLLLQEKKFRPVKVGSQNVWMKST
jgi:FkbM family methyltransferase